MYIRPILAVLVHDDLDRLDEDRRYGRYIARRALDVALGLDLLGVLLAL